MVFCGKPSGGCHACRQRKTKCDQVPEGCTQCKRAKRECPGYRTPGELVFRNESSNVIRKFKARKAREKKAAEEVSVRSSSVSVTSRDDAASLDGSIEEIPQEAAQLSMFALAPTIEDRATCFFRANYVLGMEGPSKGRLDYIALLPQADIMDEGLLYSMKAVGLAGYAHAVHAPSLLKNARYQYMRALKVTNAALRDPVEVKKDTTLISIIILGLFENITGTNQASLGDWAQHVNGAAAVIKLRGPRQVETPVGRRMMIHVTASLLITCVYKGVPLPAHMEEYMNTALAFVVIPDPAFIVQKTMMQFATLRANVRSEKLTDPHEIVAQALALDSILLDIQTNVPTGWEYETIYTDSYPDIVFHGRYHLYYDYWMGQIWNSLRTLRIMLNQLIRRVLLTGFSSKPPLFTGVQHTAQFQLSTDVMYALQADILYSVPQHLNTFPSPARDHPNALASISLLRVMEDFRPMRVSGGSFLMWPLWFVGIIDEADEEMRGFVVRNLEYIADTLGLQQARVLASVVAEKIDIKVWEEAD